MSLVSALRGAVQVFRAERAEAALLAAHRSAVDAHVRASERYSAVHSDWSRRRVLLSTIADDMAAYYGIAFTPPESVEARPGELLYTHVADGAIVELRGPNGDEITALRAGEIWVTDSRVLFVGPVLREWDFDAATPPVHHGASVTALPATGRMRATGISYPGLNQDAFRRRLDLAFASLASTRQRLVDAAARELADHLAAEPHPPGDAPVAPVLHFTGEHARR